MSAPPWCAFVPVLDAGRLIVYRWCVCLCSIHWTHNEYCHVAGNIYSGNGQVTTPTCHMPRVGLSCICAPYLTLYSVISLPKIPYVHRIYMVLANPAHPVSGKQCKHGACCSLSSNASQATQYKHCKHRACCFLPLPVIIPFNPSCAFLDPY